MKTTLSIFSLLCLLPSVQCQLEGVINEVIYTDDGSIAGYPAGYSTYRIYALLHDETDRVSSIFANGTGYVHPLEIGSTIPNSIWNAETGGNYGGDLLCTAFESNPSLAYDSYITVGLSNSPSDDCPDCVGTEAGILTYTLNNLSESFDTSPNGDNLEVVDGAWFALNDGSCNALGQGDDFRVLLAQLTVPTGTLIYCINLQIFNNGIGSDSMLYVNDMGDPPGKVGGVTEIDGAPLGLCGTAATSVVKIPSGNFDLYPNPADQHVILETNQQLDSIRILNTYGQQVLSIAPLGRQWISVPTENLPAGHYVVETITPQGQFTRKQLVIL
ncbi:MAG: T9SS type A sorting domain-containing protein [Flavobacteriales bacterium]|nr:T9SS type A sorting domain-containing protein [Flavobacteriales bacterium]